MYISLILRSRLNSISLHTSFLHVQTLTRQIIYYIYIYIYTFYALTKSCACRGVITHYNKNILYTLLIFSFASSHHFPFPPNDDTFFCINGAGLSPTLKDSPQPHIPVAFGFSNVNSADISSSLKSIVVPRI